MVVHTPSELAAKAAEAKHFTPPAARELRAQALQRLQVGLAGLVAMLLLVGLASIINEQLRRSEAATPGAVVTASDAASPESDPLADIGVIPSVDSSVPPAKKLPGQ